MSTIKRTLIVLLILGFILTALPTATLARQDEPVTLYVPATNPIQTLDPQEAADAWSLEPISEVFLSLVEVDNETGSLHPELATSWTVSDDGLVWTFTLRDDVPWVHWDAAAGEARVLRVVTATDAAYGIQRACDPRTDNYYQFTIETVIAGCEQLTLQPLESVTDTDYDLVQARALDDVTLEVTLQHAAGYFLSMLDMPVLFPVPRDVIEEYGPDWTDPAHLTTNGPWVLSEWTPRVRHIFLRNPYFPAEMQGPGNIERVITPVTKNDAMDLYLADQIDRITVPLDRHADFVNNPDYAAELSVSFSRTVAYYGFAHDKPPFDNVHARRAFAAMLDRQVFVTDYMPQVGVPITHFTPPGIFGGPRLDEVGIGFDPDYARAELALAGYPECEGLPPIEFVGTGYGQLTAAFMFMSAETVLGCDPTLFTFNSMEFRVFLESISPDLPPNERPHLWATGWAADYADANNYIGDVLSCEAENAFDRPCSEIDDLVFRAAIEPDLVTRLDLYHDIEERFFGPGGEFPVVPFFVLTSYSLDKPWLRYAGDPDTPGAYTYDWYTIDQDTQLAARGQ